MASQAANGFWFISCLKLNVKKKMEWIHVLSLRSDISTQISIPPALSASTEVNHDVIRLLRFAPPGMMQCPKR